MKTAIDELLFSKNIKNITLGLQLIKSQKFPYSFDKFVELFKIISFDIFQLPASKFRKLSAVKQAEFFEKFLDQKGLVLTSQTAKLSDAIAFKNFDTLTMSDYRHELPKEISSCNLAAVHSHNYQDITAALEFLPKVKTLNIDNTSIELLPVFQNLNCLKYLNFEDCTLIPTAAEFSQLPQLERVFIKDCGRPIKAFDQLARLAGGKKKLCFEYIY